ncbi:MAG: hypothetical protein K6E42_04055 [Synergistes sp.]|nr:hypothetical protein [Synergistes sp.]
MPIPFIICGLASLLGAGTAAATTVAGVVTGAAATAGALGTAAATTAAGLATGAAATVGAIGTAAATTAAGLATGAAATAGTIGTAAATTAAGLATGAAATAGTLGTAAGVAAIAVSNKVVRTIVIGGTCFAIGCLIGDETGQTKGIKKGYELASQEFCERFKQQLDDFNKNIEAVKKSEVREVLDNCYFILNSYKENRTFADLSDVEKKNYFELTKKAAELESGLLKKESV